MRCRFSSLLGTHTVQKLPNLYEKFKLFYIEFLINKCINILEFGFAHVIQLIIDLKLIMIHITKS